MRPKKVLLFGMSGAGKDTQAEALARAWGIPVFSLGGMLREAVHVPGPFQAEIKQALETGTLLSPATSQEIMKQHLLDPEIQANGYVLVGYPRNVPTLETYLAYEQPTHGILLSISREVAVERSLKRGRKDDSLEMIEKRINRFFEEELPVWEALQKVPGCTVFKIDANGATGEVTTDILQNC